MAGFLYFKPGHTAGINRELLASWDLGYAFPRGAHKAVCNSNNPAKQPGSVFADPARQGDRVVKMDAAAQTWRRLPKSDVWVGIWNDARPTPAELEREPMIDGYPVTLADGHDWKIPLVRRFDVENKTTVSRLPCYMECDDDGNWHRGPVLEIHAHLWDVTQPIADALLAEYIDGKPPIAADESVFAAIIALLQANYVVGAGELSLMRALTSEANTHAAVMAACDWPTFLMWSEARDAEQKKTASTPAAGDSNTSDGETVEQ